nr:WYL domain-containing protein [Halomonas sp. 25-S5]
MRDFLGAPIQYNRDANGHHYDPDTEAFELPGFWLNQSELYSLLAIEHLLESVQPGFLGPYIGPLKGRVRKLLGHSGQSAEAMSRRIRVLGTGRRSMETEGFGRIAEAVLTGRRLAFEYHGRARDTHSHRHVHPLRLVNHRSNWYLLADCEQAGDLRLFSLDRVTHPELLDAAKTRPDREIDRILEGSYGIFTGTARGWAVLRFTPEAARWVAEERWHPDQIGHWASGYYELQVPYSDPTELVMEILRYGPEVEAMAPAEIREAVSQQLKEAAGKY